MVIMLLVQLLLVKFHFRQILRLLLKLNPRLRLLAKLQSRRLVAFELSRGEMQQQDVSLEKLPRNAAVVDNILPLPSFLRSLNPCAGLGHPLRLQRLRRLRTRIIRGLVVLTDTQLETSSAPRVHRAPLLLRKVLN